MKDKYALFIIPFFNNSSHVGNYRVSRYINWLAQKNYKIIVISSGDGANLNYSWGENWQIQSLVLKNLNRLLKIGIKFYPLKIIYLSLKMILGIFLIPDEESLWARKVIKNKAVIQIAQKCDFIFSSSPLESSHLVSYKLNEKFSIPYIADLRDGWMDESLKLEIIKFFKLRTEFELKLEKKVFDNAYKIFVTTENWKNCLINRYPYLNDKCNVITNGYPFIEEYENDKFVSDKEVKLYYTGRFTGSSQKRKISLMFYPFQLVRFKTEKEISINIYSDLRKKDLIELEKMRDNGFQSDYNIKLYDFLPRNEILEILKYSDGLLLLSVSNNAVPAKFFEYIIFKKPVLVITHKNNSVWKMSQELPQFFLFDISGNEKENADVVRKYLGACITKDYQYSVPEKYSAEKLGTTFYKVMEDIII